MAGTPRALRKARPDSFEEQPHLGEAAADAGQTLDGGLGVGGGPRRVVAEVGLQRRGVGVEGGGRDDVAESPDGVDPTVPVGIEVPLGTGPGRPGQADHLGPGTPLAVSQTTSMRRCTLGDGWRKRSAAMADTTAGGRSNGRMASCRRGKRSAAQATRTRGWPKSSVPTVRGILII